MLNDRGRRRSLAVQTIFPQLLLATLEAGVTSGGKLVLELLDPACRIDELQFARVEGVAHVADIDLQLLARAPRDKLVAAAARNLGFVIFGMDAVFHDRTALFQQFEAIKNIGIRQN